MTYREFLIPKKGKGFRKITAPDAELLSYQRSKLRTLESLWYDIALEYEVEDIQHGFLPNRNCVTAAEKHIGYQTTISMDISDFFDSVTQDHIRRFSNEFGNDQHLYHAEGYASQGFATSPILANIAIIPAIAELQSSLDQLLLGNPFALTVYADDITISTNIAIDDYSMQRLVIETTSSILLRHGFSIKPKKTRTRYAQYGFRRVLGVMVGNASIKVPRKVKYRLRAALHQARTLPSFPEKRHAIASSGGLTTWSRLMLPKALR